VSVVAALTCLHFFVTGFGLFVCAKFKLFEPKSIPLVAVRAAKSTTLGSMLTFIRVSLDQLLPLIFCNTVCTPLANLSMQMNSLGFYQVTSIHVAMRCTRHCTLARAALVEDAGLTGI